MNHERRYGDNEIRQILELAIGQEAARTPAPGRALSAADGLTLSELQDVGREVGVAPARIAEAVEALERRGEAIPRGTTLGMPTTVGRVVPLPRMPSEREWELMVSEFRTMFRGKGELSEHGSLREWSYGSFHVFLEPTESGQQLRLADTREGALGAGLFFGGIMLAFALLIFVVLLGKADPGFKFAVPAFFSLAGGGVIAASLAMLPGWARLQEKRMEQLSRRAASLLAPPE